MHSLRQRRRPVLQTEVILGAVLNKELRLEFGVAIKFEVREIQIFDATKLF